VRNGEEKLFLLKTLWIKCWLHATPGIYKSAGYQVHLDVAKILFLLLGVIDMASGVKQKIVQTLKDTKSPALGIFIAELGVDIFTEKTINVGSDLCNVLGEYRLPVMDAYSSTHEYRFGAALETGIVCSLSNFR
jgi:hypothetical protein